MSGKVYIMVIYRIFMDLVKNYFEVCDNAYETWKTYTTVYFQQLKPFFEATLNK
jgi:hypothetical protein